MNMKKIVGLVMVALLALMALPANAQLKFGIKGGVNISSVHFNSDVLKADTCPTSPYSASRHCTPTASKATSSPAP